MRAMQVCIIAKGREAGQVGAGFRMRSTSLGLSNVEGLTPGAGDRFSRALGSFRKRRS
jgi:hypothetical protein